MPRTLLALLCLLPQFALANATIPTGDVARAAVLPWPKRYGGRDRDQYRHGQRSGLHGPSRRACTAVTAAPIAEA